ncbi:hypothetical protein [Halioxenophilus sp. WMMB6]|uniref:hypothetical protein n=1 Tax=Halioxenophilus sp. WMMB6 TaxID=3073815 RepID=UPI00295F00F0|nr:hypothetical protein [Halioxenophilus sp. WMMB6]
MATDQIGTTGRKEKFRIFRKAEADPAAGIPIMSYEPLSEVAAAGAGELIAAGMEHGHENRLLFAGGGMSLTYVWFKSGYPLPRHSHNSDCLYYVVGGSLKIGHEELQVGDGFFVGADVPYSYVAGAKGVEVLEFRASESFNIKMLADNPAFWQRALTTVVAHSAEWPTESRPGAVLEAESATATGD